MRNGRPVNRLLGEPEEHRMAGVTRESDNHGFDAGSVGKLQKADDGAAFEDHNADARTRTLSEEDRKVMGSLERRA